MEDSSDISYENMIRQPDILLIFGVLPNARGIGKRPPVRPVWGPNRQPDVLLPFEAIDGPGA